MNKSKISLIVTNIIALIVFLAVNFAIYHESFDFWDAFLKAIGLLIIFNIFNYIFAKKKK